MGCRFYDDDTNDCSYQGVCNKMNEQICDCEEEKDICDCDGKGTN